MYYVHVSFLIYIFLSSLPLQIILGLSVVFYICLHIFFCSQHYQFPSSSSFWSLSFTLEAFLKFLFLFDCSCLRVDLKVKWSFFCVLVLGRRPVNMYNCRKLTFSQDTQTISMIRSFLSSWSHSPEGHPLIFCMGPSSLDRKRGQRVPPPGM